MTANANAATVGTVYVEKEPGKDRILVAWPDGIWTYRYKERLKQIPGRHWRVKEKVWTVPLSYDNCTTLRKLYGKYLTIGPDLWAWAAVEKERIDHLGATALASDAELTRVPEVLPEMAALLRPYQRAGIRYIADATAPLVADEPGLGKTWEAIGGVWESGCENAVLVVAPKVALRTVWEKAINRFNAGQCFVYDGSRAQREACMEDFLEAGGPKWLIINPQQILWVKDETNQGPHTKKAADKDWSISCHCDARQAAHWHYVDRVPEIGATEWSAIVVDECHKGAIRNHNSVTAQALGELRCTGKRIAMSGTPMTKKGADIWGTLHWLHSNVFTSYWQFAERFYEIKVGYASHKRVEGVIPEREKELWEFLTPYILRRTKAEMLPELPPKQYVTLECDMSPAQRKLYREMEAQGMASLGDDEEITTTSVLAEFTHLKKFAIARYEVGGPTFDSGKLEVLESLLEERGILDGEGDEKVVVFSQFEAIVSMVGKWLDNRKVPFVSITGKVSGPKRIENQDAFQAEGGPRVMLMTTTAGGVAIDLDRADTVIFMDETWSPADMIQAEDRCHRASRLHNVTVYRLRAKGTIEDYIHELVEGKALAHERLLDIRRQIMKEAK